jgi:hypothetical protein
MFFDLGFSGESGIHRVHVPMGSRASALLQLIAVPCRSELAGDDVAPDNGTVFDPTQPTGNQDEKISV